MPSVAVTSPAGSWIATRQIATAAGQSAPLTIAQTQSNELARRSDEEHGSAADPASAVSH